MDPSNNDKGNTKDSGSSPLDSFMMSAIPRRQRPAPPPDASFSSTTAASTAASSSSKLLENMSIPRRTLPGSTGTSTSSASRRPSLLVHRRPSNDGAVNVGSSHHHRSQPHDAKPKKKRHVTIQSEHPFVVKIRLKGVPRDRGGIPRPKSVSIIDTNHNEAASSELSNRNDEKESQSVKLIEDDTIPRHRMSSRTPKRERPSYQEVNESDGLVDSSDDDADDENYAARPKKLRRGSQANAVRSDPPKSKVGALSRAAAVTGVEAPNVLDPGSGQQATPLGDGPLNAPPPGILASMWYSRECFLHIFVVEKIVGWRRRPATSLEWEDPNALKFLDPQLAAGISQKALTNNEFWCDARKRQEVSRINVTQCPVVSAIAAEREKTAAEKEARAPQFKLKTNPEQREDVLLVKWRGRSYLHCSWERPIDIQKLDPSNSTARHKIRRYYEAQTKAFGVEWKKLIEEERATAAAIHHHGEAVVNADEQVTETEEFFAPQCVEIERILGCDENEMDLQVLAKQRALNIRTEQENQRRKEASEQETGGEKTAKPKQDPFIVRDLVDIEKEEVPWDPEDNVRYVVKWKGLPYAEMTWEYWRDIKRDAVDEAEDFWHRQKPPSPEYLQEIQNTPHPHVRDFRKLHTSSTYGLSSRQRPVADLGYGKNTSVEEEENEKQGFQLRSYQLEGVNWLLFNWWNKRSCILADEMGLGKTVQTLGFLQELYHNPLTRVRGPFLIVAPLSLIGQWQSEAKSWAPDFNVVLYHGSADAREFLSQQEFYFTEQFVPKAVALKLRKQHVTKFHILITTYEVVLKDIAVFSMIRWKALIVDEAHRLKNPSSRLFAELASVPRDYCVLLTGTPLANNTEELWSLLHFDDPVAFSDREGFLEKFGQVNDSAQVNELHTILKPYLLRRVKEDVEKSLPPKEETILEVTLTPIQKKYYKAIYERNTAFLYKGAKPSNAPSLMNVMMELRKICNHPYLVKGVEDKVLADATANWAAKDENGNPLPVDHYRVFGEQLVKSSGKMVLLEKLLLKLFTAGHKVLIFSQMVRVLDLLEELLKINRYRYERLDGSTSSSSRAAAVDRFNRKSCQRFVMLLSTRAGGLGLNLTSADIVIIFDSDWNPQNDLQAMARAHRIGQTRKVQIFRLLTAKTYEMHMFHSASMKLGLERAVLAQQREQADETDDSQRKPKSEREAHAKEIDELLKKGAYDVFRDDDDAEAEKFMETDIDQLLESSSKKVTYGAASASTLGSGLGSFSKASFVTQTNDGEKDVDLDDPDFWAKAVGLEAPVETPEEVAQMLDDGVKRSRKQVQQFNPYEEFQTAEQRKKDKIAMKEFQEKEEQEEQLRLEKLAKKEKKKKKKEAKEKKKHLRDETEQQTSEKQTTVKKKKKKSKKPADLALASNISAEAFVDTGTPPPAALPRKAVASSGGGSSLDAPVSTVDGELQRKIINREMRAKRQKNDRRRALRRNANEDPAIEKLKQGWDVPQRNRATAAALRFGFGRFAKIRHESNLTSLPLQDLEVFIRAYTYQLGLQVAVTFLERLKGHTDGEEFNICALIQEWMGPGSKAELDWLSFSIYSVMEKHVQVQSCWRFLRVPQTLAEPSYMESLRQGAAFRALRRIGILSRLNRVVEDSLDSILSVLGHEELARRGCGTSDLSSLDPDLRARLVSTEELSLVMAIHYQETLALEAPACWWDRSCDIALIIGTFVHGLGNYEAMRNDEDLPFMHNIRAYAELDAAASSANSAFEAATAASRRVFDEALDSTKAKAAKEIQAAVAAAAAKASEREQNALALRQGGAAASAVLSSLPEAAPKQEEALNPSASDDQRFVTLPKLQESILRAIHVKDAKAMRSREAEPIDVKSESVEVVPDDSVAVTEDSLPMPDSRVLDRRLVEIVTRIENTLSGTHEEYAISIAGNHWTSNEAVRTNSKVRTLALSSVYQSREALENVLSEYLGCGFNGSQCGSSHRSLDDGADYSIGAASSDLSHVAYGTDAPRYLRAIGVPMNLTRFAILALAYAEVSTVEQMLTLERRRYSMGHMKTDIPKKSEINEEKPDSDVPRNTSPPDGASESQVSSEFKGHDEPSQHDKSQSDKNLREEGDGDMREEAAVTVMVPAVIKSSELVPKAFRANSKLRAAVCCAVLIYGFPCDRYAGACVDATMLSWRKEQWGFAVDHAASSLFDVNKFTAKVVQLMDGDRIPDGVDIRFYVEKVLLPYCLRLCVMGNGPSTRNARGSHGKFETAFGISLYPEPSKEVQSSLPDPCLELEEQSLEAVGYACAILRRVRLMRSAMHVTSGEIPFDDLFQAARSPFHCKNLDEMPLWWQPEIHDIELLLHASTDGLFAILKDREGDLPGNVFSRRAIASRMHSTFAEGKNLLPDAIMERSAQDEASGWIDIHAEEFPSVSAVERRLAFLCTKATESLSGENRYDNLPMFDHGGWPRK